MALTTILGGDVGLLHVAGAGIAGTVGIVGFGIATGRVTLSDIANLDMSPGKGAEQAAREAENRVEDVKPDPSIENDNKRRKDYMRRLSREINQGFRLSYMEGKYDGQRRADNEDRHFKVSVAAMAAATGALLFDIALYMGVL